MMDTRFVFVAQHAISRLSCLPGQDIGILCSEFGRRMIAAMDRKRVFLRIVLKEPHNVRRASAPVPRDERDASRETMAYHQSQELLKVDEAVLRLKQQIINHQARSDFRCFPAGLCEGPFYIQDHWDGGEKVFTN